MYVYMHICMYICVSLYVGNRFVDQETVKKSMLSYNRVICEKYVTPDNYTAADNEFEGQIESPTNVCKLHV